MSSIEGQVMLKNTINMPREVAILGDNSVTRGSLKFASATRENHATSTQAKYSGGEHSCSLTQLQSYELAYEAEAYLSHHGTTQDARIDVESGRAHFLGGGRDDTDCAFIFNDPSQATERKWFLWLSPFVQQHDMTIWIILQMLRVRRRGCRTD